MQIYCALEAGTVFPEILQRMAIMGILSSITPLLNSQTSNKHFELTRGDIHKQCIICTLLLTTMPEENQSFGTWVYCVITENTTEYKDWQN